MINKIIMRSVERKHQDSMRTNIKKVLVENREYIPKKIAEQIELLLQNYKPEKYGLGHDELIELAGDDYLEYSHNAPAVRDIIIDALLALSINPRNFQVKVGNVSDVITLNEFFNVVVKSTARLVESKLSFEDDLVLEILPTEFGKELQSIYAPLKTLSEDFAKGEKTGAVIATQEIAESEIWQHFTKDVMPILGYTVTENRIREKTIFMFDSGK